MKHLSSSFFQALEGSRKLRKVEQVVTSRLKIGCITIAPSYILSKNSEPIHNECGQTIVTVEHLLLYWLRYRNHRTRLEICSLFKGQLQQMQNTETHQIPKRNTSIDKNDIIVTIVVHNRSS